jgi:hypothetical protein
MVEYYAVSMPKRKTLWREAKKMQEATEFTR